MKILFLASVEVRDRIAFLYCAGMGYGAPGVQQRFGQLGLAGAARSHQANIANVSCCVGHKALDLLQSRWTATVRAPTPDPIQKMLLKQKLMDDFRDCSGLARVEVHGRLIWISVPAGPNFPQYNPFLPQFSRSGKHEFCRSSH